MIRGLFGWVFGGGRDGAGLGEGVSRVAEVFHPNATRRMELGHEAYKTAHDTHGAEFQHVRDGWFDRFVNGLNRLPRPALALGTLILFGHAMVSPDGFAWRMQGLAEVPEPLWWLLAAVVSFYFGAREAHYLRRGRSGLSAADTARGAGAAPARGKVGGKAPETRTARNPALEEWRATNRD